MLSYESLTASLIKGGGTPLGVTEGLALFIRTRCNNYV